MIDAYNPIKGVPTIFVDDPEQRCCGIIHMGSIDQHLSLVNCKYNPQRKPDKARLIEK
jgi:hypothetical protein